MYKKISGLVLKKTSNYLKFSVSLFLISLVFLGIFSTMFLNQYYQVNKDFIDNNNVHMLEVSHIEEGNKYQELNFDDIDKIDKIISKGMGKSEDVFAETQYNFGLFDKDDKDEYSIFSITNGKYLLKDNKRVQDNTIYDSRGSDKNVRLKVPIVDIEEGGYSSNKMIDMDFQVNSKDVLKDYLSLYESIPNKVYVSYNTYKKLVEKTLCMSWKDFEKRNNDDEDLGIQGVNRIFVYVDDISNVESIAKLLQENDYAVCYTFKSFDNFDDSMKNTIYIALTLLIVIFLITAVNIFISFKMYLSVQKKDMGILKHYGYNNSEIKKIYAKNVNRIFSIISVIALIITLIATFILLEGARQIIVGIVVGSGLIIVPSIIINRLICLLLIKKYANQNILDLIKFSKEFE